MKELMKVEFFKPIQEKFITVTDKQTFQKEISFALQIFNKNGYLNKTTVESKLSAVLNISQIGLTLNPALKLAYLVPRYTDKQLTCCLEPSYQGLVKLITDTGSAKSVYSHPVYDGDEFEETLGTSVEIIHKPKRKSTEIKLFYAVAVLHDGNKQVEVMTAEQVNEIREGSESYKSFKSGKSKSCIWESNYSEMGRKTVIRRLTKYLPKTDRWAKLAAANHLVDQDYGVSHGQAEMIHSLIRNSLLDENQKQEIERELLIMSGERAKEVIQYLKDNQLDPIESGQNYGMRDIHKKLDQHTND